MVYRVKQVSCNVDACLARNFGFHADVTKGNACNRSPNESFMAATVTTAVRMREAVRLQGMGYRVFSVHIGPCPIVALAVFLATHSRSTAQMRLNSYSVAHILGSVTFATSSLQQHMWV